MDAADLDEGSDGNDPLSAPSEFLAEFLSAIMQRQYAEALKYCRLILQYEPHNATARGFYPLLQHKVNKAAQLSDAAAFTPTPHSDEARRRRGSSSPDSSRAAARPPQEVMEQDADESESASSRSRSPSEDSCASQSSLEPDSSASAGASLERSDGASAERSDSASGSAGGWESVGTTGSSGDAARAHSDDNGNALPASPSPTGLHDDLTNDNEPAARHQGDLSAATLRRLRAQFACSIK